MEKIFTAKTVDEAKALAVSEIGLDESAISFEIIEQPKKSFFGGLKGEAKIKAIYEIAEEAPKAAPATATATAEEAAPESFEDEQQTAGELPEDFDISTSKKVQSAIAYITKVLTALGLESFEIKAEKKDGNVVLDIVGEKLGVVIGRRGETLDSLQYLAILASNKNDEPYCRISVDCNGYRLKRRETLEALAKRTALKVLKQGRKIALEPMNPYERRIIHSKVAEVEGVSSHSTGTEPYRKVVIYADKPVYNNNRSGGYRRYDNRTDNRGDSRGDRPERTGERTDNRTDNRGGDNRNDRRGPNPNGGQRSSYKQSSGFSTSFEREYKRKSYDAPKPAETDEPIKEFSKETVDTEKSATLYGKIEF